MMWNGPMCQKYTNILACLIWCHTRSSIAPWFSLPVRSVNTVVWHDSHYSQRQCLESYHYPVLKVEKIITYNAMQGLQMAWVRVERNLSDWYYRFQMWGHIFLVYESCPYCCGSLWLLDIHPSTACFPLNLAMQCSNALSKLVFITAQLLPIWAVILPYFRHWLSPFLTHVAGEIV